MERREHHRAQLGLPVRIRWNTPFGQRIEIGKTLDISRGGLLVPSGEPHALGAPVWVTFPYDSSLSDNQPEILANVVRAGPFANGNGNKASHPHPSAVRAIAFHFAPSVRSESNGHGQERERRRNPRLALGVPVRVRPQHIPWFEEAMTLDLSANGVRFLSNREYQQGQVLLISFDSGASASWPPGPEIATYVVRIESAPGNTQLAVVIARESS